MTTAERKPDGVQLIRDLSDSSGYWGSTYTMTPLADVHVICDAPLGCFNLLGTACVDYTDSIPHIENLTPTAITESDVTVHGTAGITLKAVAGVESEITHGQKQIIVVSTAESEQIGSDHTDLLAKHSPGARFYYSASLEDDEWQGRDRALRWLWSEFGVSGTPLAAPIPGTVNIIGPTYGLFNAAADLHELVRLVQGAGGKVQMIYPHRSLLADTPRLAEASVNILLHREYGEGLCRDLGRPWLHAPFGMRETTEFLQRLGELLGTQEQAAAFLALEKRTTLQPIWDLWRGPQGDWLGAMDVGIVAGRTYADGLRRYLGEELGMPIVFSAGRPLAPGEPDNLAVREMIHRRAPSIVFGSVNEQIYLAEAEARSTLFIAAGNPGAFVRRALGTPFVGFSGAVWILQEMVNGFYTALASFLPVETERSKRRSAEEGAAGRFAWASEASRRLQSAVESVPYVARISASRELRTRVEQLAKSRDLKEITPELVEEALGAERT